MTRPIDFLRRRGFGTLLLCAALAAPALQAQEAYPSRPITLVVPLPAGSDTDTVARLLAQPMADELKQPVIVENKAGAGGQIGIQLVAGARPDGYTLGFPFQAAVALIPHLRRKPPYDPERDLAPIGRIATTGNALIVPASSPFKSIDDVLAAARANPGKLTFGSWGVGSGGHLNGEALNARAQVDIVHVPYKGTAEELVALMAGDIDMALVGYGLAATQSHNGKVRVLAVPATERSPLVPDAPTFKEAGIAFAMDGWFGIVAPAGTPAPVVARLEAALARAARSPGLQERLATLGMKLAPTTAAQFGELIRHDYQAWGRLVEQAGVDKN
ncbi:Bug family tripartite tricarboxylate transporter substrate binding protein [Bordetella bronchiseptica]